VSSTGAPRALVIGGSLGGLFAATTLRAIGWEVQVFERSAHDLDGRGGGVVLQPDVLGALRFAGIEPGHALGVRSGDRIYLDREDRIVQRQHMPQTQSSWNMIYTALKQGLPDTLVQRAEQLVRFEDDGERIHAHFAGGRVASGELLIGADGPRSTVRRQLLPGHEPRYAGYVAWRGLVPEAQLPAAAAAVLGGTFAFQQGPGHLMLEYVIPGDDASTAPGARRWNWVWYRAVAAGDDIARLLTDRNGRRHAFSLPPGAPAEAAIAELRRASKDLLAPTFQQLVAATDEPFVQAILDLQVPQMVFGRALLMGDAAFVPRPHTAGSTAKAAADAVALARALRASPLDVPQALARWQATQLAEGRGMTDWGMSIGDRIMGIERSTASLEEAQHHA
jgi:2-polyprenyl-6-methoxyphenol hydroxylase-like FAD-dependent oxidoreductase